MKNQLKKQHRQWIAFVLALLAALTVLASCKKDPSGGDDTQISGDTTTEQSPAELCLFGGSDTYNIIRSESETETVLKAVKELRNAVNGVFGDTWQGMVTEDWIQGVAKGDIVDNDNAEILIGLTNRRESHTVSETLGKDEYVIRAVGKKLVIIGSDEYATAQAVEAFIEQYLKNIPADKRVAVSATLDVKGEASLQKVPVNSEAQYRIMTWNLGCEVGKVEDAYTVMMKYLPDILSLQECNKAIHTKLINKLPKFYSVTTRFHANGTTYVYTPIIYNTETLDLKEAGAEWLRDRYTGTNTKSVAWAVFEGKNGGTPFAVIDFHGAVCSNAYKGYENLTKEQLNIAVREQVGKELERIKQEATDDAVNTAMVLLLTLPLEVLMDHYWTKTYAKRIPRFTELVLEYYERWQNGELDMDKLKEDLWEYGGVKLVEGEGETT